MSETSPFGAGKGPPSFMTLAMWIIVLASLVLFVGGRPHVEPPVPRPPTPAFLRTQVIDQGRTVAEANGCQGCHTAEGGSPFAGARIGPGWAPNITPDPVSGVGTWSDAELLRLLREGRVPGRAQVSGPMAMVVQNLADTSDGDLRALVAFLRAVVPVRDPADTVVASRRGGPVDVDLIIRGSGPNSLIAEGGRIYSGACASCHGRDGGGSRDGYYPSLFHNGDVGRRDPGNLILTILVGVERTTAAGHAFMPGFDAARDGVAAPLSDRSIAAVATFVRATYGEMPTPAITEADIRAVRDAHGD